MNLKEIGEFGFIERFKPTFDHLVQGGTIGIGDDCAIIPVSDTTDLLVTTDLLIEDVHFLRDSITPEQLGHKSLAVNLSDIAAMGGTPVGSFLSIAIPPDITVEYLDRFMEGYHNLSSKYKTPLLGGDTTKSLKHIAINVCVIGECPKDRAKRRNAAQPGDIICTTGFLGDSAAGLNAILSGIDRNDAALRLIGRHHTPEPRISEGTFLGSKMAVHALMDISDGIASDLTHILKASDVGAAINMDALPISADMQSLALANGWDKLRLAAAGGEDYELLCTVAANELAEVNQAYSFAFGKELIPIGTIIKGKPAIRWMNEGAAYDLNLNGFNHFV